MNISNDKLVKYIKSVDIHNTIGTYLEKNLKNFIFNKKNRQLERKTDIKTDIITWDYVKYQSKKKTSYMFLEFIAMIRHNYIDSIIEKYLNYDYFTKHSITNYFLGEIVNSEYQKNNNIKQIYTISDLLNVLNEVSIFFMNKDDIFFNNFITDDDFFKFYCIEKSDGIYGKKRDKNVYFIIPTYRRLLFCKLLRKNEFIEKIHKYHKKCMKQAAGKHYDKTLSNYYYNTKILEELYNNSIRS